MTDKNKLQISIAELFTRAFNARANSRAFVDFTRRKSRADKSRRDELRLKKARDQRAKMKHFHKTNACGKRHQKAMARR
jgi:hypothetical protein